MLQYYVVDDTRRDKLSIVHFSHLRDAVRVYKDLTGADYKALGVMDGGEAADLILRLPLRPGEPPGEDVLDLGFLEGGGWKSKPGFMTTVHELAVYLMVRYRDYCRHMGEAMCRRLIFTEPTLSQEELLDVYQTTKSTNLDILRDTAVQMFPERFQEKPPQLYVHQGGASAFRHHGVVTRPDCTIGAAPLNQIGVMADGMAYPY